MVIKQFKHLKTMTSNIGNPLAERRLDWRDAPRCNRGIVQDLKHLEQVITKANNIDNEYQARKEEFENSINQNIYSVPYYQYNHMLFVKQKKYSITCNISELENRKFILSDGKEIVNLFYLNYISDNSNKFCILFHSGTYHGDILKWNEGSAKSLFKSNDYISPYCEKKFEFDEVVNYCENISVLYFHTFTTFQTIAFGVEKNFPVLISLRYELGSFNPTPTYSYLLFDNIISGLGNTAQICHIKTASINVTPYFDISNRIVLTVSNCNLRITTENTTTNNLYTMIGQFINDSEIISSDKVHYDDESTENCYWHAFIKQSYEDDDTIYQNIYTGLAISKVFVDNTNNCGYIIALTNCVDANDKLVVLYSIITITFDDSKYLVNATKWKSINVDSVKSYTAKKAWDKICYNERLNEFVITYSGYASITPTSTTNYISSLVVKPKLKSITNESCTFSLSFILENVNYAFPINDMVFNNYYNTIFCVYKDNIFYCNGNTWENKYVAINTPFPILSLSTYKNDDKVYALVQTDVANEYLICILNYDIENEWKSRINYYNLNI